MKKLNHILLAGLALVAAVSCNKVNVPAEEPEQNVGVPMTLTATIGGAETKMTMAEDDNVLKATWDASEKISVITYTGTGYGTKVQTVDTFTYTGDAGKKSVDFTGTFTGDAANNIWVVYPALEYDSANEDYRSASGLLYGVKKDDYHIYIGYWNGKYTQTSNADPSFLKDNLLTGTGTVSGSALTVDLEPASGVLKMTLTLPSTAEVGSKVYGVKVTGTGGSLFRQVGSSSWTVIGNTTYGGWDSSGMIALNGSEGITVPDDRKLVCYMPFEPYPSVTKFGVGGITAIKVDVSHAYYSGINWVTPYSATKTLTADPAIAAEPGKMYRLELVFD